MIQDVFLNTVAVADIKVALADLILRIGDPTGMTLYPSDWALTWQVNPPTSSITYFRSGDSVSGDLLEAFGSLVLRCETQQVAPAHTVVLFPYGNMPAIGPGSVWVDSPGNTVTDSRGNRIDA